MHMHTNAAPIMIIVFASQAFAQEENSLLKSAPISVESKKGNSTNSDCVISRYGYRFDTERLRIGRDCMCDDVEVVPDEHCPAGITDVTNKKICYIVGSRIDNNEYRRCKATAWLEYYEVRNRTRVQIPE